MSDALHPAIATIRITDDDGNEIDEGGEPTNENANEGANTNENAGFVARFDALPRETRAAILLALASRYCLECAMQHAQCGCNPNEAVG